MPNFLERFKLAFRPAITINYSPGGDINTQVLNYSAAELYRTQDNLQAVIDFLAQSIAQLPLKVYVREDETKRRRDRTSVAAQLLYMPNKAQTEYEFIRSLYTEYAVFGNVYIWLIHSTESISGYEMYVVPTLWVKKTTSSNIYAPDVITISCRNDLTADIPSEEFIQFKTYSPGNPGGYLSPIGALKQQLTEQIEAGNFRKDLWKSSGRLNAQIVRPKDVAPWDEKTRDRFIEAFRKAWGSGGSKAGSIPLLEDGMEIKPYQTSFKEQQWMESVTLSRESVSAIYHVNPSLVWHSGTQTYASAKDNARSLYADALGPILQFLQQRINNFLLPKVGADPNTYVEFDLAEKLKGSFEERASILQSAVGGPWMTRNEARADSNLPPVEGGDELIVPLNVVEGGQASPQDTHMTTYTFNNTSKKSVEEVRIKSRSTKEEDERMGEVVKKFFDRQQKSVIPKIGAKAATWWDKNRWDKELADDIEPEIDSIADFHGENTSDVLGTKYDPKRTRKYLRAMAEGRATAINDSTYSKLEASLKDDESSSEDVFSKRKEVDSPIIGGGLALASAGWSTAESCRQAKDSGFKKQIYKEWVTGDNARESHQLMNGERVPIDEPFSNGAMWPGDDSLDPDESCGCNCSTDIVVI